MNDAGRIGFLIKGNYNDGATYNFLDVVYHNGSSYVAKTETSGNIPTENGDYWQILAKGTSELGGSVTGVKGNEETIYRTGDVNITPENIGVPEKSYEIGTINTFPIPGSPKILYVDKEANVIYRWDAETLHYIAVGGEGDLSIVSDEYVTDKDYLTGEYAIRDNILYRFISDKAAGEWDKTAVEQTTVGVEFQALNAKIEWKLLGTKSSPTHAVLQIPIPEDLDFSELCVVYESYNAGNYIFNIPRQALTPNKGIRQGFYSSANLTGFASLNVSATLIQMGSYNQNGVAATNVVMTVYYR